MLIILIILICILAGFCIISSEDLLNKSNTTYISWVLVIMITGAIIGCLFIYRDSIGTDTLIKYEAGKVKLDTIIRSDTTFILKKCKN